MDIKKCLPKQNFKMNKNVPPPQKNSKKHISADKNVHLYLIISRVKAEADATFSGGG